MICGPSTFGTTLTSGASHNRRKIGSVSAPTNFFALIVHTTRTLLERIMTLENCSNRPDYLRGRRRHEQGGQRAVIEAGLAATGKGSPLQKKLGKFFQRRTIGRQDFSGLVMAYSFFYHSLLALGMQHQTNETNEELFCSHVLVLPYLAAPATLLSHTTRTNLPLCAHL